MKKYTCNIKVQFGGNSFKAETEEEYIEKVKKNFLDEFGIELADNEISEIEVAQ